MRRVVFASNQSYGNLGCRSGRIPRFFTTDRIVEGERSFMLDAEETKHALAVLRLKKGSFVELCDGKGTVVHGIITETDKTRKSLTVDVESEPVFHEEPCPRLILCVACGSLKGNRADWLIEKATELGAATFIPLLSERSPVVGSLTRANDRVGRWRRVSISASKQCLRTHLMQIESPINFEHFQERVKTQVGLLAVNGGINLHTLLHSKHNPAFTDSREIVLIIGPEGDFSDEEKESLEVAGCIPVSLGSTRLRVETAAIALLSTVHLALHS